MKFCAYCGNELLDEAVICPRCGCATDMGFMQNQVTDSNVTKSNSIAIIGFIFSFFIPLLGWIFCSIGLRKADECNGAGRGLSIAGLIVATINFVIGLFTYYPIN